ncbi:MAG: hypothetical protein P8L77_01460 [Gammaproteobacteria bacterium]|nr:hypothetical protein [Gammaproteobacteria bacterium]
MFENLLKSINEFWISFYNWWYGLLPATVEQRKSHIKTLVEKNKRAELEHRILHNFTQNDKDVLVTYAIEYKNHNLLKFIRHKVLGYNPNLSFNNGNLLLEAFEQSEKCFVELLSMLLSSTTPMSEADNKCIKHVLKLIITEIKATTDDSRRQSMLNIYKSYLVNLLPYQHNLLDEEISIYGLVEKMYAISEQKKLLEKEFDIQMPLSQDKSIQMNKFLFKVLNGDNATNERHELSFIDETIDFEKSLYDDEGNSLLTRLLAREDLTLERIHMITSMNSDITLDFIEDDMYSFKDIEQMFKTLTVLVDNKSPLVNEVRKYAKEAFNFVCNKNEIQINKKLTIHQTIKLFKRLDDTSCEAAKRTFLYDMAANIKKGQQRQLFIQMFDDKRIDAQVFQNICTLLPGRFSLEDSDIKFLLKKKDFSVEVISSILDHFELGEQQMSLIFKFLKEHSRTYDSIRYKDIYLWHTKFSQNLVNYLHNNITDLFRDEDWKLLFSINLNNYETVKTLYSHYIFNLKEGSDFNPFVQESITLLADAINQNAKDFAEYVLSVLNENNYIKTHDGLLMHLQGVTFEAAYKFLKEISYEQIDELMFDLATFYLNSNRGAFVKVGLESLSNMPKELLNNIYVYIVENELGHKDILNLIRPRSLNTGLENDLKLLERLFSVSKKQDYTTVLELFSRILFENVNVYAWSDDNLELLSNILNNNLHAKEAMKSFLKTHEDNQDVFPLFARCIASLVTLEDQEIFHKVSKHVFESYVLDGDQDMLVKWFEGVEYISGDVLQVLLKELDVLPKLLTGFDLYETKHYDRFIKTFIKLCAQKDMNMQLLTKGLGLDDVILIEELADSITESRVYFKQNKLAIYSEIFINLLSQTRFEEESFENVLLSIQDELDEFNTHKVLNIAINLAMDKSNHIKRFNFVVNKLPNRFVSTYIASSNQMTFLASLESKDNIINGMLSYTNAKSNIIQRRLLSDHPMLQLNDQQLVLVWSELLSALNTNTRSIENVLWFMDQYSYKGHLAKHFSSFVEGLPRKSKQVFNKFVYQVSRQANASKFIDGYWKELRKWNMNSNEIFLTNKYDVSPFIINIFNTIDDLLEMSTIQRGKLENMFELINRLSMFPLSLRRKYAIKNDLYGKIIQLEVRLNPQNGSGSTLIEQMTSSNYDFIGDNLKAFINMMGYDLVKDYYAMIDQSKINPDDIIEFLMLERNRGLYSYDFDTNNIKGKIPNNLFLVDHYKKAFISMITYVLDEVGDRDGSVLNMLEWIEFDQLVRNIAKYDTKKVDFKKLAVVMGMAPSGFKEEAARVKKIVLDKEIMEIENVMSKISEQIIYKNKVRDMAMVDKLTTDLLLLETTLEKLDSYANHEVKNTYTNDILPKSSVIISCCKGLTSSEAIIDALEKSPEGRKLIKDLHSPEMKSYYSKFFQVSIKKYLEVHKHCQKILNNGLSICESMSSSIEKHALIKDISEITEMPQASIVKLIEELDNILYIIQFIMTWYHVSATEMTAEDKAIILKVIDLNGPYLFDGLLDDSKNVNLHYVDNYFVTNMENLKALATKRVLSGSRASMNDLQGLFSIADKSGQNAQQKESATYGAKRLSQMFGLNK